ncbi:hypothetical protein Gasu2_24990 [Galdieria sulphuraria]|uniref:Dolichyl-diphosphooligosaccharide-protein glycosyltransferase subunit OST5 n=1 Tax=Galdieria sulphuraria TaxID=130081 RepID=M2W552_GALSU|nr:uncharacterized protein Gasu_18800 [Galdieria sulphuraria]EME30866.1 hypothetical protein Gasu_18800 [Galdieria sulphuraria]GJD08194.1 hypothetical protein Gasu2_24990 [Galdieria sulphuraria]|eukprot:XP_005707386.1 hypothetical protein Gasu_18800 [Galdieria sulphuraria]
MIRSSHPRLDFWLTVVFTLVGWIALLWFLLQLAIATAYRRSWKQEWLSMLTAAIGLGQGLIFALIYNGQSL